MPPRRLLAPISVTPAAPDAIRSALAAATATRNYESRELRDAVSQFAADLHTEGVPPERMLIAVKQLADDTSLGGVSDWWRSIVTDRLVRWAVEGYYRIDLGGTATDEGSPR
jgi:hypothetical protein